MGDLALREMLAARRWLAVAGLTFAAIFASAAPAAAVVDSRTVNSTADPGDGSCATNGCTLREAITELNADDDSDQDVISIAFNTFGDHTIFLTSDMATITEPVAIASTGIFGANIDGADMHTPIHIDLDTGGLPVSITGLGILNGSSSVGIVAGGGISSANAALTVTNSTIHSSGATDAGGGIFIGGIGGGSLLISNSTVSDNVAANDGGGIYTQAPSTLRRVTLSGNRTTGTSANGGALSTFAGNGPILVENSTVSGNRTENTDSDGGGIYAGLTSGTFTVSSSTVVDNLTQGSSANGGGIKTNSSTSPTLTNTIVANNNITGAGSAGPNLHVDAPSVFNADYSLVEGTPGPILVETVPGSNLNVDPMLGTLAQNGGPTTHRPLPSSPAIDKGSSALAGDQRQFDRPADFATIPNAAGGNAADIGSVEIQIQPATFSSINPVTSSVDDTPTVFGPALPAIPDFVGAEVHLFTDPACADQTGPVLGTSDDDFETTGITVDPVPHNAVTTFHGLVATPYGQSACSSGPFPNTISFTHGNPNPAPPATQPGATPAAVTGLRAAALRKCKKIKNKKKRKKCKRRARRLPV